MEDDVKEEDRTEASEALNEPELPVKTILLVVGLVCALVIVIIVSNIVRQKNKPDVECAYRGGVWDKKERECIYESGVGEGKEQVGMLVSRITLSVPDQDITLAFEDVEIGVPHTITKTFNGASSTEGGVSLISALAKVHKETKDLIMPFAVNGGGTGTFLYLGVFEESSEGYVLRDAHFVGDRLSAQSLALSSVTEGAYTARFAYRDRGDTEARSAVPTEPRSLEVTILNHQIDSAFVLGRDGLYYKNLLRVSAPSMKAEVSSPLLVAGMARGTWFFEASFPVTLVDWDGKILAEGVATAQGDWMTEDFVPFTARLTYTLPADIPYKRGALILKKDNPSGLPENDDAFEMSVTFK